MYFCLFTILFTAATSGKKVIMNLGAGRDIFDEMDAAEKSGVGGYGTKVHIRIQMRNGRKSITYVNNVSYA